MVTLQQVKKSETMLQGRIFTDIQLKVLKKRLANRALNSTERTYYYKFIKPKIRAMESLFEQSDYHVRGREYMLEGRIEKAREILQGMRKRKAIISGSFLFRKDYNDIDLFILSKYAKPDIKKGRLHMIYLTDCSTLLFNSIVQVSVSNFVPKPAIPKIDIEDLLVIYEQLMLSGDRLREYIIQKEFASTGTILNPLQLFRISKATIWKNSDFISNTLINAIIEGFPGDRVINTLKERMEDYRRLADEYRHARNVPIYLDTYRRAIELAA